MAENFGAVSYDVEVSTANMLKAEAIIDKSLEGMVKEFDKADKAIRDFEKTQRDLGRTINSMGQVLNKNGKVVANASQQYRKLAADANTSFGALNTQVTGTARAINGHFNQALTNTSYQIQDIAVQLAGGQNPFLVMAQQIPQLLTGMGALAAGIGGVVAVLGGLYLAFGDSATNAEKLEKAIEQVKAVMTVGADGVANYSEELEKLNAISEMVAKAKLASAIQTQESAIKNAFGAARDTLDDFGTIFSNTNQTIAKETGFSTKAISELDKALTLRNADGVEAAIGALSSELSNATSDGREFFQQITDIAAKLITAKSDLDAMNGELKETGSSSSNASNDIKDLVQSLLLQREELQGGERAALNLKLTMDGLSESERNAVLAIYDTNAAIKQQKEEAEASATAIDKVNASLDAFFEKESQDSEKEQARKEEQGERFATGVIERGMSPTEKFAQEQEKLHELREQALISQELYDQAVVASVEKRAQEIEKAEQRQEALMQKNTSMMLGSASDLFGGIADIVKNSSGEQSSAYKALFAVQKGFAIAQAGLNLSTAISNALAIPFPANIPAIAQATAAGTQILSQISSASYSGGREFGGPVSAGSMYRVGEKGKPEFYKDNLGRLSMITGENGEVIPADGMGANWTIVNNNYGPGQVYTTIDDVNKIVTNTIATSERKRLGGLSKGTSQEAKVLQSSGNYNTRATR